MDEENLKKIDLLEEEELRQEFNHDMMRFLQYMSMNINPKTLSKNAMTGNVFKGFLTDIVTALNQDSIPYINSVAERLFQQEAEAILAEYSEEIEKHCETFKSQFPMSEVKLHKEFDKYINDVVHNFKGKTENSCSTHVYAKNQEILLKILTDQFDSLEEENMVKSMAAAETSLNEFIADYKIPNIVNKESFSKEMIQKMKKEFLSFVYMFKSSNKGPGASDKCLEILPEFLFETFDSIYSRMMDVYDTEFKELQTSLSSTNVNHDRMKDFVKDQEKIVMDLNRNKNKLTDEIERLKHDLERLGKTKEAEIEGLRESLSKYEGRVENLMNEKDSMKKRVKELEQRALESSEKVNLKQREIESLAKKLESNEKLIMEYSKTLQQKSGGGEVEAGEDSAGLYEMIKFLNKQVEKLNTEVRTRNQAKVNKMNQKLENKEKEIRELLEERQKSLMTIREEYSKKIKQLKKLYEDRIEELEKKIHNEYEQNKKYKMELFDKKKLELELRRAQMLKEELGERIKTLEESNKAKDMKSEINQETFTKFIKQIETIKLEKSSYEDKLMKYKEQALTTNHEMNSIINCVNNVVARSRDKTLIAHMIRKLAPESLKKLSPFFKSNKIKI